MQDHLVATLHDLINFGDGGLIRVRDSVGILDGMGYSSAILYVSSGHVETDESDDGDAQKCLCQNIGYLLTKVT